MAFSTVDYRTIYVVPLLLRITLVHSRTHPFVLAHAGLLALGMRAVGRRPIHCSTRCNRTNNTAHGAGLGPFGLMVHKPALDQPDACMLPSRLSGTPLERFRVDPRATRARSLEAILLNSDLKSGRPRIDKTQSPPSVDHLRVLCARRRSTNLVARRRSRDKASP